MRAPGVRAPGVREGVAVVIAAWRASATIEQAVASALAQPETAEVIVVDDASADSGATLDAARAADDGSGRLTCHALSANGGPARARNVAMQASTAPWICVLDSDDYMEPGRLGVLLQVAASGYDFVADDPLQVEAGADPATRRAMWFEADGQPIDLSLADFLSGNISRKDRQRRELGFIKPLMARAFLERHALAYDETMRLGEDYDLYVRALAAGARFRLIPAAGYVAVMRGDSLSARHDRKDLAAFLAADINLLARGGLSAEETRLVQAHRFSTERRIAWIDFMDGVKALDVFRALGVLLRDPRQTAHLLGKFAAAAARRIARGRSR